MYAEWSFNNDSTKTNFISWNSKEFIHSFKFIGTNVVHDE